MHISKIQVENFRALKNLEVLLEEKFSLVIGKNNCGKTSFLVILEKFLGSKPSLSNFSWDDFSIDFQNYIKNKINQETSQDFEGIPVGTGITLRLYIEFEEKDNISNLSRLMADLDEENKTVVLEYLISLNEESFYKLRADFQSYKEKQEESESTDCYSQFMKSEFRKYFKINVFSVSYDKESGINRNIRNNIEDDKLIEKVICFKAINAHRSVSNERSNGTLSKLSSRYFEKREELEKQKEALEDLKIIIGKMDNQLDDVYESLFSNVIKKVEKFGGIQKGDSIIKIVSSLQEKNLLEGNTTVMYDHGDSSMLPENYNGLGYLNLISMIFEIEILMSSFRKDGKESESPADINLFFIEEPEAHTHPQMQSVFIKNIKDILESSICGENGSKILDLQTVVTTHSASITAESDFDDIKYFYKKESNSVQSKCLKQLEISYSEDKKDGKSRYKFLKQYLTHNRAELFFADKVIFVEGETERILLPEMMKKIDETATDTALPLLSQNISIVDVGAYSHVFEKLIDFLKIKSLIITDFDTSKVKVCENGDEQEKAENGSVKKKTEPCRVSEGKLTTNSSLTFFFNDRIQQDNPSLPNAVESLKNLNFEQKKLSKKPDENAWEQNTSGMVVVTFQTLEKNDSGIDYCGRSFEDSFFHLNKQFIIKNIDVFESLKNKKFFLREDKDAFDLANHCILKKPSFAIEILLASHSADENNEWKIPQYIKEGLIWLKQT